MYGFSALGLAFTAWMAFEAIRRGQAMPWIWLILFFPPIGGLIYFFAEYLGHGSSAVRFRTQKVTAADVQRAAADVKRLDNAASWYAYATALRSRRQFAQAVEAAKKALERDPTDVSAQYELGRGLLGAGQPKEAIPVLESVLSADRWFDTGDALLALAKAQESAGDAAGARKTFEELANRSRRPEILYSLAKLQLAAGEKDAARSSLQQIVDDAELTPAYNRKRVRPWVRRARAALRKAI
jgi:hypothetical protein